MIRVACVDISSVDESLYRSLYEKASLQRRQRADRYLRQEDKLRCVTAEALLKAMLGVDDDQTVKNAFGKPYIRGQQDVYYNLSHSGRYVVLAWGDTEVGVDVQRHDSVTDMEAVGIHCFTPDERLYIQQDANRFYEIWTKKESFLKYTGKGFCAGLTSFSVLKPEGKIRYFYCTLSNAYSLSLCTEDAEWKTELLNAYRLL